MAEAERPIKESAPYFERREFKTAKDPLPEIGFIKARGKISDGKEEDIKEKAFEKQVKKEDAERHSTATTSPKTEGKMQKTVLRPSFAPSQKREKTFSFFKIP
jgi:hypothetical protein